MSAHWPLHRLRLRTPNLELRVPDEAQIDQLLELARQGIHDPATMPFLHPWTDLPEPEFTHDFLRYWWRTMGEFTPASWRLDFVVLRGGRLVGTQGVAARDLRTLQTVRTGSWLGRAHHGQGIGLEMRRAVLTFAFDHLGAEVASTGAMAGNAPSLAITRRLGYEPNGWEMVAPRGTPIKLHRFVLTRPRWEEAGDRIEIEVEGLEACRPLLGI